MEKIQGLLEKTEKVGAGEGEPAGVDRLRG